MCIRDRGKMTQGGSKISPRTHKILPGGFKDSLWRVQDGSEIAQGGAKKSRRTADSPRRLQDGFKRSQEPVKRSQNPPRSSQEPPKMPTKLFRSIWLGNPFRQIQKIQSTIRSPWGSCICFDDLKRKRFRRRACAAELLAPCLSVRLFVCLSICCKLFPENAGHA